MGKQRVIVFSELGARILINPSNIEDYKNAANALINPDLSKVKGLPPHLWELNSKEVVPMHVSKRAEREALVSSSAARFSHALVAIPSRRSKFFKHCLPIVYALSGALLALFVHSYF